MPRDIYSEIVAARSRGEAIAMATIIARRGSTPRRDAAKMLVYQDGRQSGTIGGGCTEAEVCRAALDAIRNGKSRLLSFDLTDDDAGESALLCGGTMEVYVEPLLPDPDLIIFGAGHVGQSIAAAASVLGFRITAVDDRVKYANPDRFPQAADVLVAPWEEVFERLKVRETAYLVIATRGHQQDLACLRYALQTPAKYIGLLGSTRKTRLLYDALEREGIEPARFERVYAPVGIEIGSETPEEIAISVVAELVAVRKGLDVRPLKLAFRHLRQATVTG
jgi:xanthine dehydrogenase accessory factor